MLANADAPKADGAGLLKDALRLIHGDSGEKEQKKKKKQIQRRLAHPADCILDQLHAVPLFQPNSNGTAN
jgi:hypothetical protein